jgi:chromate transport protein ChrA
MTEQITFQESAATQRTSLRDHLGPLGFAITFVAVVLASFILGAGISLAVKLVRRPPIVTPTHGALSQAVVASVSSAFIRQRRESTWRS